MCVVANKLCREKPRFGLFRSYNFTLKMLTFYETYKKNYVFLTIINTRLLHNNNAHAVGVIPVCSCNILHRSHAQTLQRRVYYIILIIYITIIT